MYTTLLFIIDIDWVRPNMMAKVESKWTIELEKHSTWRDKFSSW